MLRRLAAFAVALSTTACVQLVGPARTAEDYELKAANTAEAVLSALGTARITVDASDEDRLFGTTTAVLLAEAESGAEGAASTFAGIQPPDEISDELRVELNDLLEPAIDVLADLRIAARRDDAGALPELAEPLDGVIADLEAFAEEHG